MLESATAYLKSNHGPFLGVGKGEWRTPEKFLGDARFGRGTRPKRRPEAYLTQWPLQLSLQSS
jgi:hypothetical protein